MRDIKCRYILKVKQPEEWRGQDTALGKTEPDRYGYCVVIPIDTEEPANLINGTTLAL